MLIIIQTLLTLLGALAFLFFFWRKLKDDYTGTQVFTGGFYTLFGLAIGFLGSKMYLPIAWLWFSLMGSFIGLMLARFKFKYRFFESLEGWIIGNLSIVLALNTFTLIRDFSLFNIVHLLATLATFAVYFFINKRYKKYVWYRSGREGFSGLLAAGLYLVFRASFLLFSGIINKVIIIEAVLLGILAFVSFLTLYNLSKKEI